MGKWGGERGAWSKTTNPKKNTGTHKVHPMNLVNKISSAMFIKEVCIPIRGFWTTCSNEKQLPSKSIDIWCWAKDPEISTPGLLQGESARPAFLVIAESCKWGAANGQGLNVNTDVVEGKWLRLLYSAAEKMLAVNNLNLNTLSPRLLLKGRWNSVKISNLV